MVQIEDGSDDDDDEEGGGEGGTNGELKMMEEEEEDSLKKKSSFKRRWKVDDKIRGDLLTKLQNRELTEEEKKLARIKRVNSKKRRRKSKWGPSPLLLPGCMTSSLAEYTANLIVPTLPVTYKKSNEEIKKEVCFICWLLECDGYFFFLIF